MNANTDKLRAADHLVDLLVAQGTDRIFGVPGESYLAVLDALHGREDQISYVTFRQEGGAAMAAEAHGKLTGRPGICMVTRGPGATNASAGIHIAYQDSTPMIVFIGQVARDMMEREAFQEIDYRRMFGQMAKWVAQIDDASRIQEFVSRAYRTALSGRPGPVVLALPEDMLYDEITPPPAPRRIETPRYLPSPESLEILRTKIASAKKPLIMAGGGGWTPEGISALERFAERQGLPVTVSLRSQSLMNNDHPNYTGHFAVGHTPYLAEAMKQTDLLIAIGPRLGEMTTASYTLPAPPVPSCPLVHVFPQPEEPGRVYEPDLALISDMQSFCLAVSEWEPISPETYEPWTKNLRAQFEAFNDPASVDNEPLAMVFAHLAEALPADAILCNGAGNYAGWLHRFYRWRSPRTQLAPTSGSMGYGLPGAIGAAASTSGRQIIAIAGDGCFMMTSQEMATAVHHGHDVTVIVINNGRYGTIRAHQEREFPKRLSGTELTNPDFCAFARSFGAKAWRAETFAEFEAAFGDAQATGGVRLIEIIQDPMSLSPGKRLV